MRFQINSKDNKRIVFETNSLFKLLNFMKISVTQEFEEILETEKKLMDKINGKP